MQVTLAQKKGQAIRIASRCLWDASNDTYASFVHENQSLICNCQVNICSHSLLLRAAGFLVQWTVRRSTACTLSRATALAATAASDMQPCQLPCLLEHHELDHLMAGLEGRLSCEVA